MNLKLKLKLIENKQNGQFNFSLPKKKISDEMLEDIKKNKFIKLEIMDKHGGRKCLKEFI